MSATPSTSVTDARPDGPISDQQVRDRLREIAVSLGQDADRVCAAFAKNGPLTDLLQAMLGGRPKLKRGRGAPVKPGSWDTYFDIERALAERGDRSREEIFAEYADAKGLSEKAAESRYNRRKKQDIFR